MEREKGRRARILCGLVLLVFGLIVAEPLRMRVRGPSIYADDVVRIAQVRTMPLSAMLVRPFNEHLAPLFDLVTAAAWLSCDGHLTRAPLAFTLASLLPFALCEIALFALLRRETGSLTASLSGLAVFGVTWLPIETAWWYSASSFAWSLLGVLIAWLAVLRPGWRGTTVAVLAALAAPAFSMIGILAGPIAVLRAGVGMWPGENPGKKRFRALIPLAGSAGFLAFAALFGHQSALEGSVRQNVHVHDAIGPILRAPATVLLPALAGVRSLDAVIPPLAAVLTSVAALTMLLGLVARRKLNAGLVLCGLSLVVLGYGLTYAARAGIANLMNVQRYHLFPHAGLALILAALVAPAARRVDRRPIAAMGVGLLVALTLLMSHRDELKGRARYLKFEGQAATLAAMEHLERLCDSQSISRDLALSSLDPVRNRWFDFDLNALTMIDSPDSTGSQPPRDVRPYVLRSLTRGEREALWGGMDATRIVLTAAEAGTCLVEGRLDHAYRVSLPPSNLPDGLSYLEYDASLGEVSADPRTLRVGGLPEQGTVEVWWKGREGRWSEARSFRLEASTLHRKGGPVSIPLEALPHWDRSEVERLQIRFHGPGRLGMIEPRFYR